MKRSIIKSLSKHIQQSSQINSANNFNGARSDLSATTKDVSASLFNRLNLLLRNELVSVGIIVAFSIVMMCFSSCNVTRIITNESQYLQRGDTSVVIQTKTIETYDASKKL